MLQAFGLTDIGCVRPNNEDFYALIADANLYVIADGMGGCQAGEVAAQMAVETVVAYFRQDTARDASALFSAFEQAHQKILAAASSDERLLGMGCTLVAETAISIASVGDSRAYVFADETSQCCSSDQTRVNSCTLPLKRDIHVLLCTDGLHDLVSNAEIADKTLMKQPADWKCRRLVEAAKCAGGPDNITVLVLEHAT